jgi:hypothetical protein
MYFPFFLMCSVVHMDKSVHMDFILTKIPQTGGTSSNSGAVIFQVRLQGTVREGGGERPRLRLAKYANEAKPASLKPRFGPLDWGTFIGQSQEGEVPSPAEGSRGHDDQGAKWQLSE